MRLLVWGVSGVGKTTFAAAAPNPIFLCTEEGAESLNVARFPLLTSYEQ
ncbi:AAA family ATPase, partial [Staphylococcus pseudintermedius]